MVAPLKAGDKISVCIKDNLIAYTYVVPDEIKVFEIIATDNEGVYVFVPNYYFLKGVFHIDQTFCNFFNAHKKFIGETGIYIQESLIKKVTYIMKGTACANCNEHYEFAEPNQPNGTLICYLCRFNRFR